MKGIGRLAAALIMLFPLAACDSTPSARVLDSEDAALGPMAWLTGAWVTVGEPGGPRTEEHWIAPSSGTMLGVNRTVAGGRTVFFEYLRIERTGDGETVYLASPQGREPATPFRLVDAEDDRLVFENPDHDYPQRIIYIHGTDGSLTQRIEGEEQGVFKQGEWSLVRARLRPMP